MQAYSVSNISVFEHIL